MFRVPACGSDSGFGGVVRVAALDHGTVYATSNSLRAGWFVCALGVWLTGCKDPLVVVGKLPKPPMSELPAADSGSPHDRGGAAASAGAPATPAADSGMTSLVTGARALDNTPYAVSLEAAPLADFCKRTGTALTSMPVSDCEARVERRLFAYGLCACDQLQLDGDSFSIDSFDSRKSAYAAGQTGGSIAVGSTRAQFANNTELLGNLLVAGDGVLDITAASFVVAGDLKSNAALTIHSQSARVARDLWLGSDLTIGQGQGMLRVDRDVLQAPGHSGLDAVSIGGRRLIASDLRVPKPCSCDADAPIDVAALVAQARQQNDNAAAGFNEDALMFDGGVTDFMSPPCGRIYASAFSLRTLSTYIVAPASRSAVFIQGDLTVYSGSSLFVTPFAPGELDLFIAGNINVQGTSSLSIGDDTRPWATRVYVAGEIKVQGSLGFAAQVYAPHAALALPELARDTDLYGSVYAREIHLPTRRFHYDRAILQTGTACSAPAPQRCATCNECPNELACSAGSCVPCTADADCCEPAVCEAGKCQPLVSKWP